MRSTRAIVAVVVAALAISVFGVASYFRKQAKSPEKKVRAPLAGKSLTPVERRYLDLLAKQLGAEKAERWTADEMLPLLTRLNQERNALITPNIDTTRTPWLLPTPKTLPGRELRGAVARPFDLAAGRIEPLPTGAREYQYAITNTGSTPAPMPILYAGVRWDSFDALMETSGLRAITDEVDRAIAVWRFVAAHRVHGQPVTEGDEEHDLIKYLACYGYGFCDDSAQAVTVLASACGLKARIRGLGGHVVPEIFAGGKWRMLDPDFAVYFHSPNGPREIFGVDELAADRSKFAQVQALGSGGPYDKDYADLFLTTENNTDWPLRGTSAHRIEHTMAPGERVVFSNFNWGKYFLGAYPDRPPRFYNGYFALPLTASGMKADADLKVVAQDQGFTVTNSSTDDRALQAEFTSPFPIVGGQIAGLPEGINAIWVESGRGQALRIDLGVAKLDSAVAQLREHPTYLFQLKLLVPPGTTKHFATDPRLTVDFQFSENALLKLGNEERRFGLTSSSQDLRGEVLYVH